MGRHASDGLYEIRFQPRNPKSGEKSFLASLRHATLSEAQKKCNGGTVTRVTKKH